MLVVDAMAALFKTKTEVIVIVSSDTDMVPLLKAIKYENKITCLLSTKNGFNQVACRYADYHEYIEDLFNLPEITAKKADRESDAESVDAGTDVDRQIDNALEVARLLYSTKIWQKYEKDGIPVSLKGYILSLVPRTGRGVEQLMTDFNIAQMMEFVTLYDDPAKGTCIERGKCFLDVYEDINKDGMVKLKNQRK